MPTFRCDNTVPEHIKSAVTSSQTVQGEASPLFGCVGLSIQAVCSNGAAGTLYVDGSNQLGKDSMYQNIITQAMTANQTVVITNSLADDITAMHKVRCRFVSSAAGNIQVSLNGRRTTY